MNDFEQEVKRLWDEGHLIPEIAEMYGKEEEVIESIVEAPGNYGVEP